MLGGSIGAKVAAAAARIVDRREQTDDPDRERLPDEPLGVLGYLRTHRRVPDAVLAAEIPDALTLVRELREELDRHELMLLERARQLHVPLGQLGPALGLSTRQGVETRRLRLRDQQARGTRDEKHARAEHVRTRREARWLTRNGPALRAIALTLTQHRDQFAAHPDIIDWIDHIDEALASHGPGDDVSPGLAAHLRLTLQAITAAQAEPPLPEHHHLRAALRQGQTLTATFRTHVERHQTSHPNETA